MPSEIRKHLTREHGSTDWFIGDLRRSIFKELAILESGRSTETFETATYFLHKLKIARNLAKYQFTTEILSNKLRILQGTHFSSECTKYTDHNDRMKIVKEDRLCFNCLRRHRVVDCKSKSNCKKCDRRHHTSLCSNEHDKETLSASSTYTDHSKEPVQSTHFRATNLGEKEETHNTEDKTERNTINIEHISRIMDTSRTKQRTTGPLTVNETYKSDLMWTRDIKQNKYFYDDLQGMRISKSPFKQLTLYQELDYKEKLTRKKESEINLTPYYIKLW
ncbi:unnamed protein product [Mytilus coruscus]|uniref:Uncharacterized protein n=1 Tax=Mytilus coruscus TaxID=42192 RepID=A0A6J8DN37_MYTCO|nr:unnamed protein product [Mytilus coruscus]